MRISLVCLDPPGARRADTMINFAVRRLMAELGADCDAQIFEGVVGEEAAVVDALLRMAPDLIGASAYVWSLPSLLDIAAAVRSARPATRVVVGGPSARPAMFALDPYRARSAAVDALVLGEGERTFRRLVETTDWSAVPGIALREGDRFRTTTSLSMIDDLDALASPYAQGLVPRDRVAVLETFRGCPMSCAFCQWGDGAGGARSFSATALARDLRHIAELAPPSIQLVDAALNLNPRAFRALVAAEAEVSALSRIPFSFEVYPTRMTEEHLAFLRRIRLGVVGVGLQSFEPEVLQQMHRHHREGRVEEVVRQLAALGADVVLELILGLPGDGPETFLRTLERARALPCSVRVFHCLALPDALMTRAPEGAQLRFDPLSLRVLSSLGWSEGDLERISEWLDRECDDKGGGLHPSWTLRGGAPVRHARDAVDPWLASEIARVAPGFRLLALEREPTHAMLRLVAGDEQLLLEAWPTDPERRAFVRTPAGVDLAYRGTPSAALLRALRANAAALGTVLAAMRTKWV